MGLTLGFYFHDIVGCGFALAGGADLDIAGFIAELGEVGGAEVAHAGLDAADELGEDTVDGGGDFLEGFDAFGGDLLGIGGGVSVACGGSGFHGGEAAHAAVLFIEFTADFHDLAGGFGATGEEAAAHDALGEGEGLDDIAGFSDAAVGEDGYAFAVGDTAGDEECGHLGDTDACDCAGGAD